MITNTELLYDIVTLDHKAALKNLSTWNSREIADYLACKGFEEKFGDRHIFWNSTLNQFQKMMLDHFEESGYWEFLEIVEENYREWGTPYAEGMREILGEDR